MSVIAEFQGPYRFLSNFYEPAAKIKLDVFEFSTAEHVFQAFKTLDFCEAKAIEACGTPGEAKRMGRKVTLRPDWDSVKERAMEIAVARKFLSDPVILRMLLLTGDAELIEGNKWHDNFWGACSCAGCEGKIKNNALGEVLMSFRDDLSKWTRIDI